MAASLCLHGSEWGGWGVNEERVFVILLFVKVIISLFLHILSKRHYGLACLCFFLFFLARTKPRFQDFLINTLFNIEWKRLIIDISL